MPIVPTDPRPQFSGLAVVSTNGSLGRMPYAGSERVGPDAYVIAPPTMPRKPLISPLVASARGG
jgi:hypothetical protein